ncbi:MULTISPECIES: GGDEF domain-containing protein [unclassified Clostridioides]|uniref:GGDEF domain-containing protein n=1 Tax=unclassified Clostridioides TaxID=2635829 RepID=UPI001D117192|nr:GGDEF domain-containing protein [Clostridioides sp. ZZV14-6150]MCC0661073.1 GGDEF domain-containing protein [Clostridioides sp. ZZV14-6154]MCC0668209.1 GGDEF domain-containing protein [Clostridioides sp. ZZV14-6153]MCC0718088.1 GGDEF domain-containing protein [Clostridioides sp. ZZV14-6105]MCC0722504.1 GGDEF domain-containing protein [Clostridioides sp. ZZV14-6104]MCC0743357.1 GGDEF domain-containing protein [Clostridioides sp. ZZV14-6044]MCC0751540.1 GGDEF domain-containing protein [Clost
MKLSRYEKNNMVLSIILCALIISILVITVFTTVKLYNISNKQTKNYLNDVSTQIVSNVDNQIEFILSDLRLMADFIKQYEGDSRYDYLAKRKTSYEYSDIGIIDLKGEAEFLSGKKLDLENTVSYKKGIEGKEYTELIESLDVVLYSVPIFDDKHEVSSILVGVSQKESVNNILSIDSFNGEGTIEIVNTKGKPLFIGKNSELIKDISHKYRGAINEHWVPKMMDDFKSEESGEIIITSSKNVKCLLTYHPVTKDLNDWYFVLIVPEEAVLGELNKLNIFTIIMTFIIIFIIGIITWILYTIRRKYIKQIEDIAYLDNITNGINSTKFSMLIKPLISKSPDSTYMMIAINIKDFKLINDCFGSEKGNNALKYIYNVLEKNIINDEEFVCRHDADLFYLFIKNRAVLEVLELLYKIENEINYFNKDKENPYFLRISVGIYTIENHNEDLITIQDHVNTARKSFNKTHKSDFNFYSDIEKNRLIFEKELSNLMEKGLADKEFFICLQPKVDIKTGKIRGAESLVRWNSVEKGMIYPSDFVPLFEKNGFICELDLYVLEETCKLISKWIKECKELLIISVNVSRQHLKDKLFLEKYEMICNKYNVPTWLIDLELTESIFLESPEAIDVIDDIHSKGFKCSIDDFGFGYSSLGILKDFKVEIIKLDRSFFVNKNDIERGKIVVESVIELSRRLGMKVIAEGIEEVEQVHFLRSIGCDYVQGYVFSKPLSISEFEEFTYNDNKIKNLKISND